MRDAEKEGTVVRHLMVLVWLAVATILSLIPAAAAGRPDDGTLSSVAVDVWGTWPANPIVPVPVAPSPLVPMGPPDQVRVGPVSGPGPAGSVPSLDVI